MNKILVSKAYLPSLAQYAKYLKKIWKSHWLTNDGPLVQELEQKLQKYLGVKHVVCVSSGTAALMVALKALDIKKEVYVSPDSFVATVSAPLFLGIKPIFQDYNELIEGPAIITHLYGKPNLPDYDVHPVIYDASHAFPFKHQGKSLLSYGDISIVSFHAVKIFHTVEGGAVITNNDKLATKARLIRNFGFNGPYQFSGVGVNFKMSELHAAMGLCNLPMVKKIHKRFNEIAKLYNQALGYDYQDMAYYPIYYPSQAKLLKAITIFNQHQIYPKRYFYPPLNQVFGGKSCPLAEEKMMRVLCLPLYYDLKTTEIKKIIKITLETLK